MKEKLLQKLYDYSNDNRGRIVNVGMTPCSLLGLIFIVLKLTGTITWSWWWILAPFWIPLLVCLIFTGILIVIVWHYYYNNNVTENTENTTETATEAETKAVDVKEPETVKATEAATEVANNATETPKPKKRPRKPKAKKDDLAGQSTTNK